MTALTSSRFLQLTPPRSDVPLFVFLPGMDGTGKLYRNQLGLQADFDVRCLSIPPDDVSSWEGLALQTARLIKQEKEANPGRPVYLCGESFGGCLALKLARYVPDSFDYLILVNPASSFSRQFWMRYGSDLARLIPPPLFNLSGYGLVPWLISIDRVSPENRQALYDAMHSVTQASAAWRLSLVTDFDLDALPLHRLRQRTLVIAAARDRLLPSVDEANRLIDRLPNAHKVVLPHSGHACLLETDICLAQILKAENFFAPEAEAKLLR
ncbi:MULTISPECIES: alpha/beta hydrolase [unclassified Leptolyngbya]|uniref:alpha/beta fold hydrolase n=1 Tax=unclassified Leptolyngbya TaxID=2650499 RepID=UPI00168748BC|nr:MULTISPECIES: alpha/beta hydrolase [unclassified Leptolyngbya]MBD1911032.1 alpha/beta hydrolase [Leptolyngbya sp. FACHB-8]MBD2158302.1 alpha/beta hydrolase [Leptolyngbya sp. FACHB-16]